MTQALKRELGLLALVVKMGFQEGWITENEQLLIKRKATLDLKKLTLFEILTSAKCDDENAARLLCALRCLDEIKLEPEPTGYSTNLAEHYYLSFFMSELYDKHLVTREQNLIYEKRLREEQVKENVIIQENNVKFQICGNQRNPVANSTNPMLIVLVINCFLEFLTLKEVKNARYISKVWSSVGLNELKRRSTITFSPHEEEPEEDEEDEEDLLDCELDSPIGTTPIDFFSVFPIESLQAVPFTNFRICGYGRSTPRDTEELNYFFRNQKNQIKKLDCGAPVFHDENLRPYDKYDISSWLINSALTKPNTKYHTKLQIGYARDPDYDYHRKTNIFVQLSALVNIKEVILFNCGVDLQEEIVISPTKIQITDICFHKDGNMLPQICINDIVDFSNTKEITLCNIKNTDASKIILEMGKNADIKIENLNLNNITLRNFRTCKWSVDYLRLENVSFTESTDMLLQELRISMRSSRFDISVLPNSIEYLTIFENKKGDLFCSHPVVLHNLEVMMLCFNRISKSLDFLHSQIFKCPFLDELNLYNESHIMKEIELTWIPQTLTILKLRGICIKDEGMDCDLKLDKLILDQYAPDQIERLFGTHIQTKTLVFHFPYGYVCNNDAFLNFLKNQNICIGVDQRIYAGHFNWMENSKNVFEQSPLRSYVDKEARHYIFENQVGKAIDYEEFEEVYD